MPSTPLDLTVIIEDPESLAMFERVLRLRDEASRYETLAKLESDSVKQLAKEVRERRLKLGLMTKLIEFAGLGTLGYADRYRKMTSPPPDNLRPYLKKTEDVKLINPQAIARWLQETAAPPDLYQISESYKPMARVSLSLIEQELRDPKVTEYIERYRYEPAIRRKKGEDE